jgi:hypothetical protein
MKPIDPNDHQDDDIADAHFGVENEINVDAIANKHNPVGEFEDESLQQREEEDLPQIKETGPNQQEIEHKEFLAYQRRLAFHITEMEEAQKD